LQQQAAFFQGQGFPVVRLRAEFGQPGGYVQVVRADGLLDQPVGQPVLPVSNRDETIAVDQRNASFRDTHVGAVRMRMLTAPLTVVNGTGYAEQVVAGIVSQVEELTALVADVVELARGDEPPSDVGGVDLEQLVERATTQAQRHWPAVTFELETAPVTVPGVPQRLERAVANLLDNAGKFSPSGSSVQVTLTGDARLTVRDHGPGIPDDALPQVFERFYRADDARALPGSGLGLAIVKQAVENHGGTVTLRNYGD